MKATELMIGDWVCLKDDTKCEFPLKVDGVLTDDISLEGEGFLGGVNGLIRPIPITPEILEKNGLEKTLIDEEYCYSLFTMDYVIVIRTNRDGYWKYDSVREIGRGVVIQRKFDYVHELQHALRLCGFDELADNFKI